MTFRNIQFILRFFPGRTQIRDKSASEGGRRERRLFQVEEFDVAFDQNSWNFCIGEVVVLVHADQQGIPGDSFGSGPPESDLPVPEATLLVALC